MCPRVKLSISIAICTYNRPQPLKLAVSSILDQTRLPNQVIIVDDGNLPEFPFWREFEEHGVEWLLIRKEKPGLTESRAKAIEAAWGEIIFCTDDDVKLDPHYIEETMKFYENDPQKEIAGIGGWVRNIPPLTRAQKIRHLWDRIFLISGTKEGKILPSGFCTEFHQTPYPLTEPTQVDVFGGLTMSYRGNILKQYAFSPGYHEYALDEDKDITYRISQDHCMISIQTAKLHHYESQQMRPDHRNVTHRFLKGRLIFFDNYVKESNWNYFYFWWAIFGYTLARLVIAAAQLNKKSHRLRLWGIYDFFKEVFQGKIFSEAYKYGNKTS